MTKLAIFDCDGTLVDSGATIHRALSETIGLHGIPRPPARECRKVIGLSLTQAMGALVPDATEADHFELAETY
ncbi:MAG: HAD hydrolase-like protein, partial [Sphingomicrobium sp.]